VVTKSGTNQFHGSVFEFYRDKGMNANTFVNNRGGAKKQAYHFNQFGGTFGGRIVKDKLFFFASYDAQRNTSNQIVVPNIQPTGAALAALSKYLVPYSLGLDNKVFLGKVDWNATQSDRLSVRYNLSRYTGKNFESNSATSALEHTGDNKVNTNNVAAVYTKVIGARVVWDLRFNYVGDAEPGLANTTGLRLRSRTASRLARITSARATPTAIPTSRSIRSPGRRARTVLSSAPISISSGSKIFSPASSPAGTLSPVTMRFWPARLAVPAGLCRGRLDGSAHQPSQHQRVRLLRAG